MNSSTYDHLLIGSDLVTAAKNIRRELREAFPGVAFSVRSRRFAGGDAIDIEWTDGPPVSAVQAITDKYSEGSFDGMTDSYDYRVRGEARDFNERHGGAKYVQTRRTYSPDLVAKTIDSLRPMYGDANAPTADDFLNGRAWNRKTAGGGDWSRIISDALSNPGE